MYYRALVSCFLRPAWDGKGGEWTTALAAGSREHCIAAAMRHGPGASVVHVPDDGARTVIFSDRGAVIVTGNA